MTADEARYPAVEQLATFDLRLRSLDREKGEPYNVCTECGGIASWSVWLHTPEWGPNGGDTRVLCTRHALDALRSEATRANKPEDCSACQGDECAELRCPESRRPCGHHCNCVMMHDYCHWCGTEWGES